jgi:hypothetical protein
VLLLLQLHTELLCQHQRACSQYFVVGSAQVLWCVLQSYTEFEAAIKAVLADPVALRAAAAPKKLPGAKDPADPDEGLPVSCSAATDCLLVSVC